MRILWLLDFNLFEFNKIKNKAKYVADVQPAFFGGIGNFFFID